MFYTEAIGMLVLNRANGSKPLVFTAIDTEFIFNVIFVLFVLEKYTHLLCESVKILISSFSDHKSKFIVLESPVLLDLKNVELEEIKNLRRVLVSKELFR